MSNAGWEWRALSAEELKAAPEAVAIRGYKLDKSAGGSLELDVTEPGDYELSGTAWPKCPPWQRGQSALLGSAPARPLCLLRAHLASLGGLALLGRAPASGIPAAASEARASRLQRRPFHWR